MSYNCFCRNFVIGFLKLFFISVVLFLIVSLISCGEAYDKKITITKQELTNEYKIIVIGKSPEEIFASKELSRYLGLFTYRKIQILDSLDKDILDGKFIIVGTEDNPFVKNVLGINVKSSSNQSFTIKVLEKSILIIGKKPIGTLYGVYYFLEKYAGFRFLSKDFTYIPEFSNLEISNIDDIQTPRFIYREIFIREGDDPDFSLKRLLNGRLGHRNLYPLKYGNVFVKLHGIYDLVPPNIYRKSHPEYFCGAQLDFTNEDVKRIALKNARKILNRYKDIKSKFYFVIGHADNGNFCLNERSRRRIKEGKSPSTPYLDFVVFLAEKLGKQYPNAIFTASAYLWSRKPPENYRKLPKNVAIFFSDIEADFSKPINSKENHEIYRNLINWAKLSDNILIWHYITNFNNYFQPYPNVYTVAQDIKEFSKIKQVKGIFLQGSYGTLYGDMSDLKLYVFSKLLWNPSLDVEILINDFIEKFYGEASIYIKEYFNLLYDTFKKNPYPLKPKLLFSVPYLTPEFFVKAEKLLSKGLESVKNNSQIFDHIRRLKFPVDLMLLLNNSSLKTLAEMKGLQWFDEEYITKLKKDTIAFIKEKNIKTFSEGGKIDDLLTLIDIKRTKTEYPEETEGYQIGKKWFDYQEYTLQVCCGARFEEDTSASDGVSVSMPGSTTAWGISLNLDFLPEGKWKVFFRIKVKPNPGYTKDDVAFRYGVYRKTRAKRALLKDFSDGKYHTVYIGIFKRRDGNLWIAPPGSSSVEKIFVDRVFIIKEGE